LLTWRAVDHQDLNGVDCHIHHVTIMMRPFVEALRTFKREPFRSIDLVEKLGYATGYARNFLSQATRQGLLIAESRKGKREKTFRANPSVVKEIVLKGGKEKEELLEALGLHSRYAGEYVALKGFRVVDHDPDLYRLGERALSDTEAQDQLVITNVGVPRKIVTIEI
jgi:hypothetical protein